MTSSLTSRAYFNPERMTDLDSSQVGTVGEFFVASILAGYGLEVHHTKSNGYDLLVCLPDGKVMRVDVKTKKAATGSRQFSIKKGKTTTFREYETGDCDIFALVCLEDMSVVFERCEDYDGKNSIYINRDVHRESCPYESWVSSITPGHQRLDFSTDMRIRQ